MLQGPLSPRRQLLVSAAYSTLDLHGQGYLDPHHLIDCYHPERHPDVLTQRRTTAEVKAEFLDTFDVGNEVDGRVTRGEFVQYYRSLSALTESDEEFEGIVCGVWRVTVDSNPTFTLDNTANFSLPLSGHFTNPRTHAPLSSRPDAIKTYTDPKTAHDSMFTWDQAAGPEALKQRRMFRQTSTISIT